MTFQRIDVNDKTEKEGRSCIIIYNFKGKELNAIKNYAKILGMKDQIVTSYNNGDSIIKEIIDDNKLSEDNEGIKEKAIIFNNISSSKMSIFIDNLKKMRINNTLMATVTETSMEWSLNKLIFNLIQERKAINKGRTLNHE